MFYFYNTILNNDYTLLWLTIMSVWNGF